jgi:hypothetical protein
MIKKIEKPRFKGLFWFWRWNGWIERGWCGGGRIFGSVENNVETDDILVFIFKS